MRKDFNKIIEEQNPEEKQALREKLKSMLGISEPSVKASSKRMSTAKIISVAVACLCVLCVAITLPIVLTNQNSTRYCTDKDYQEIELNCTLKEYAEQTGRQLLYIDWYDLSEETETFLYASVHDVDDMIFVQEFVVNDETGDMVHLYAHDNKTQVERLVDDFKTCESNQVLNGLDIKCGFTAQDTLAIFEYQGYKYYIKIREPNREDLLQEVVENMLNK